MLMSEYLKLRGNNSLTAGEARVFGIDMKSKWIKANKNRELSIHTVVRACNELAKSPTKSSKSADKILEAIAPPETCDYDSPSDSVNEKQYLYLMKNVIGLYKIGISIHPHERTKQVQNGSGVPVKLLAYWYITGSARTAEVYLHKYFKNKRKYGEWFSFNECPREEICKILDNSDQVYHNKLMEELFDDGETC